MARSGYFSFLILGRWFDWLSYDISFLLNSTLGSGHLLFWSMPSGPGMDSNFPFRVLVTWGVVKQVVLQAAHEKSAKPLTENRYNKMRSSGQRRRQGMTLNRHLWSPLKMGLSCSIWMPKTHSGSWSGEGSVYVAGVTWTYQNQFQPIVQGLVLAISSWVEICIKALILRINTVLTISLLDKEAWGFIGA